MRAVVALTFFISGLTYLDVIHAATPNNEKNGGTTLDIDSPPKTRIQLTPTLSLGARAELEYTLERNFNLDRDNPEDLSVYQPILSLALSYTPAEYFTGFLNIEPSRTIVSDEENKRQDETRLEVKQAFIKFNTIFRDSSLKIGRQRFKDEREWLYDDELDGVRLLYAFSDFSFDLSVSEKKNQDLLNDNDDESVTNYVINGRYMPDKNTEFGLYGFARDDKTNAQDSSILYGLHLHGELVDDLDYWFELAHVRNKAGTPKIRGFGTDLGFTYKFGLPLKPSITLGYAFGSGDDDPFDDEDNNFRQTGLQDNQAKLNGVTRLKYYGEMVDPELSNLVISTIGIGIRPTRKISIDIVYHDYHQAVVSDVIRDSEIDEDPNGINRRLGGEIDLVAGYRFKPHHKGSLTLGYFRPGEAFPDINDPVLFAEFEVRYEF